MALSVAEASEGPLTRLADAGLRSIRMHMGVERKVIFSALISLSFARFLDASASRWRLSSGGCALDIRTSTRSVEVTHIRLFASKTL